MQCNITMKLLIIQWNFPIKLTLLRRTPFSRQQNYLSSSHLHNFLHHTWNKGWREQEMNELHGVVGKHKHICTRGISPRSQLGSSDWWQYEIKKRYICVRVYIILSAFLKSVMYFLWILEVFHTPNQTTTDLTYRFRFPPFTLHQHHWTVVYNNIFGNV